MAGHHAVREYDTPLAESYPRPGSRPRRPTATQRRLRRSTGRPPVRLTRRGRVAVLCLAATTLALVGVALGRGVASAGPVGAPEGPEVVVVAAGETLWQIAARVAPEADRRATVDRLQEVNGLNGSLIVPGQSLLVPTAP